MINCGECKLCCQWGEKNEHLRPVLTDREADHLEHEVLDNGKKVPPMVDGSCMYLSEKGCSIHFDDYYPIACRKFDCRSFYDQISKKKDTQIIRILAQGARKLEDDAPD